MSQDTIIPLVLVPWLVVLDAGPVKIWKPVLIIHVFTTLFDGQDKYRFWELTHPDVTKHVLILQRVSSCTGSYQWTDVSRVEG